MLQSKYYVKKYNEMLKDDWYQVINKSDSCWMFHDRDLCEVYAKRYRASDESFLIYDKANNPVAIVPLFSYKTSRFFGKTMSSFDMSGPAFINNIGNAKHIRELIRVIDEELSRLYKENKIDIMKVAFPNLTKTAVNNWGG